MKRFINLSVLGGLILALSSCSQNPFGSLGDAMSDIHKFKTTDLNYMNSMSVEDVRKEKDKREDKSQKLENALVAATENLNGKSLAIDTKGEIEIVKPLTLSYIKADDYSVKLHLTGEVKAVKEIEFTPCNPYHAKRIEANGVRVDLAVPYIDPTVGYSPFDYGILDGNTPSPGVAVAKAVEKDGKFYVEPGTIISIDTELILRITDADKVKAASKGLWLAFSGVSGE